MHSHETYVCVQGRTALHHGADRQHKALVSFLIAAGADVHATCHQVGAQDHVVIGIQVLHDFLKR